MHSLYLTSFGNMSVKSRKVRPENPQPAEVTLVRGREDSYLKSVEHKTHTNQVPHRTTSRESKSRRNQRRILRNKGRRAQEETVTKNAKSSRKLDFLAESNSDLQVEQGQEWHGEKEEAN